MISGDFQQALLSDFAWLMLIGFSFHWSSSRTARSSSPGIQLEATQSDSKRLVAIAIKFINFNWEFLIKFSYSISGWKFLIGNFLLKVSYWEVSYWESLTENLLLKIFLWGSFRRNPLKRFWFATFDYSKSEFRQNSGRQTGSNSESKLRHSNWSRSGRIFLRVCALRNCRRGMCMNGYVPDECDVYECVY